MTVRNDKERRNLERGGRRLAAILQTVVDTVKPGATTQQLNDRAAAEMKKAKVTPAFLGYHGYPAVLCTSVNVKVVHGIPNEQEILKIGDIVGLDIGIKSDGIITDMAVTVGVGTVEKETARLIRVTKTALDKAIAVVRPGATTGDIGAAVQEYVESEGFGVVRDLVGHGVGRKLHEEPVVPNFGIAGRGEQLVDGMVIAIEPMVTAGDWRVQTLGDGWSVVTRDGSLAAHFEHTVLVTADGVMVITAME
ncbi:MAG: type I methionyl aminopeptidase [Candidatus Kerfeldbacteria bacterium]|nr:type I methionyl aminopeptidase [Candidatus Kerfeldbacteria bacterium]